MRRNWGLALVCATVVAMMPTTAARAETIQFGTYALHNHPDGNAQPPSYGMRLDELFDATGGHDIFTFDFDHASSNMHMDVIDLGGGDIQIHIYGVAYGGLDTGSGYTNGAYAGIAAIDFTYLASAAPGDDDLIVAPGGSNTGTITFLGSTIDLYDSPMGGYSFRLGDEDDDLGHRFYDGISGWGWMDHHTQGTHIASSDWLFTAELIPLPPAVWMMAAGLLGVVVYRRRFA